MSTSSETSMPVDKPSEYRYVPRPPTFQQLCQHVKQNLSSYITKDQIHRSLNNTIDAASAKRNAIKQVRVNEGVQDHCIRLLLEKDSTTKVINDRACLEIALKLLRTRNLWIDQAFIDTIDLKDWLEDGNGLNIRIAPLKDSSAITPPSKRQTQRSYLLRIVIKWSLIVMVVAVLNLPLLLDFRSFSNIRGLPQSPSNSTQISLNVTPPSLRIEPFINSVVYTINNTTALSNTSCSMQSLSHIALVSSVYVSKAFWACYLHPHMENQVMLMKEYAQLDESTHTLSRMLSHFEIHVYSFVWEVGFSIQNSLEQIRWAAARMAPQNHASHIIRGVSTTASAICFSLNWPSYCLLHLPVTIESFCIPEDARYPSGNPFCRITSFLIPRSFSNTDHLIDMERLRTTIQDELRYGYHKLEVETYELRCEAQKGILQAQDGIRKKKRIDELVARMDDRAHHHNKKVKAEEKLASTEKHHFLSNWFGRKEKYPNTGSMLLQGPSEVLREIPELAPAQHEAVAAFSEALEALNAIEDSFSIVELFIRQVNHTKSDERRVWVDVLAGLKSLASLPALVDLKHLRQLHDAERERVRAFEWPF